MSGLPPLAQAVVRAVYDALPHATWELVRILAAPDDIPAHIKWGREDRVLWQGSSRSFRVDATGVKLPGVCTVEWAALEGHARDLDPSLRAALIDLDRALREVRKRQPDLVVSEAAVGCGRAPQIGPLTLAQHLFDVEVARWERELFEPWQAELAAIDAARPALLDAALPLASEPPVQGDLLALLTALPTPTNPGTALSGALHQTATRGPNS